MAPDDRPPPPFGGEMPPPDDAPIVIHGPVQGSPRTSTIEPPSQPAPPPMVAPAAVTRSGSGPESRGRSGGPAAPGDAGRAAEPRRALGLDALRGFFLVLMTFSFTTDAGLLPRWLYHRQTPPPDFSLVNAPGIGWPDLAYPAFVFAMAAALPIALMRRIDAGETEVGIVLGAVRRFLLLFVFALMIGHSNTFFTGYTQTGRALAILGFVIMFAMFVRRRKDWSEDRFRWVNRIGWIAAALFLALSPLAYGRTFSPARRDEIIAYLAVASLVGSVVWFFTRNNWGTRLAILAGIVALYLGARGEGWIQSWWWSSPAPWLFRPTDLGLMTVVIPGTIAGDIILRWMRSSSAGPGLGGNPTAGWSTARVTTLALLGVVVMPVIVMGLYAREVEATSQVVVLLCLAGAVLVWRPVADNERMLRDLFAWAALWLLIGLFLEPSEGGIKKVPDTLSYFFTVTGVTMMLLMSLMALVEVLGRRKTVSMLVDVGHNPMLTYVLYTTFLNSLLEMIPALRPVLSDSAGGELLRAALSTLLVVLLVQAFTRRRIFWRT